MSNDDMIIVDGCAIDTSKLYFTAPKPHEKGGKVVGLHHRDNKKSLTISTPRIFTWGAQEVMDDKGNHTGKYTISFQFPTGEYNTPELTLFLENMKRLVEFIQNAAMEHSETWFGEKIDSLQAIRMLMSDMLKYPKVKGSQKKDLTKPPSIGAKIPKWKTGWQTEIYDEEGEPLFVNGQINPEQSPLEYLPSKIYTVNLLTFGGLWFTNGKMSPTWNLTQSVVQKPRTSVKGKCFLKLKESDKEFLRQMPAPDEDGESQSEIPVTIVQDSDDDEPETVAYVPAPVAVAVTPAPVVVAVAPPAPPVEVAAAVAVEEVKPKKTVVRKKTTA